MSKEPPTADADLLLREEMVAYLDGELDAEASLRLEQRMGRDPQFAAEVQALQRSWELLEELPADEVDETFAATTVEMIALAARDERTRERACAPRKRAKRFAWGALFAALAAVAGYLFAGQVLPDPNAALLRDLPVLENLDRYQQVESIEFLRQLHQSGLFVEQEAADAP